MEIDNNTNAKQPKRWRTILSDPPWDLDGKGNYAPKYPLLNLEAIKSMPIKELTEENAHLWIWVTNGMLPYVFDVLDAYGFTFRNLFTWCKPRYTLGQYLRNASEYVIFATKGKAPVKFRGQPNWGFYPLQGHSHKPEEIYDVIERVSGRNERVSGGDYLELFARRKRHGWDSWGNEIESDVKIEGYPVPKYSEKAGV
ncbi:MAG: MT-A70 family methyltransferase [Oscillospiraceae bacterium]|nr:MT-A70 family methyltransferase [Oscillospiraceae bacterium]